jgi:hypothetical protein
MFKFSHPDPVQPCEIVNAAPLLAPDDDGVVSPVLLRRVVQSLTKRDLALLERLEGEERIDAETADVDPMNLIWMGHFGLLGIEVDDQDRIFAGRRPEGKAALDERYGRTSEPRRKTRRKREVAPSRRAVR